MWRHNDAMAYDEELSDRIRELIGGERTMTGFLRVDAAKVKTKRQLSTWTERGVAYARSLPPKQKR